MINNLRLASGFDCKNDFSHETNSNSLSFESNSKIEYKV